MNPTDERLLRAFRRGDDAAFEELVGRHGVPIKAYALRMLRSPELAEEVYSETFLRVARSRGKWERRGTVRGWLFTIAHRICVDLLRRRRVANEAMPGLIELHQARAIQPSPEALAVLGERASALEDALAKLPELHRQTVLLRTIHGLSAGETAQALGVSESQVHSQLSYARKRLKVLLESDAATAIRGTG